MDADTFGGVGPTIAVLYLALLLVTLVFVLIVISLLSRSFQRAQDRRWARTNVTRGEWLRINAGILWRSTVDRFRQGH